MLYCSSYVTAEVEVESVLGGYSFIKFNGGKTKRVPTIALKPLGSVVKVQLPKEPLPELDAVTNIQELQQFVDKYDIDINVALYSFGMGKMQVALYMRKKP